MKMTAGEMVKAFEMGTAAQGGYYISCGQPGTYCHVVGGDYRRTETGRKTGYVELTYRTNGRRTLVGVWQASESFEVI